jgi:hypothetical protein
MMSARLTPWEVEGRSVSDVAREAIAALVEARRKEKRFRRLLEDSLARHQRLLDLPRGRRKYRRFY